MTFIQRSSPLLVERRRRRGSQHVTHLDTPEYSQANMKQFMQLLKGRLTLTIGIMGMDFFHGSNDASKRCELPCGST
jgi:hypothetical protein